MKSPAARAGLQAAALALLAAAFFAPGIAWGELPVFRDLLVLVLPLRHYTAEALWRGEIPLWSPEIFFGAPYLANYQSAVLYPPSLLAGIGSMPIGLSSYLAFHVALAGIGTARYLERAVGIPSSAAVFGGVVFAFGGFFFSLVSLTNQLAAAAWLPWVLLAAERLRASARPGAFVALAIFVSLQLLTGAPEVVLLTGALVGASAARGLVGGEEPVRSLTLLGAAFAFAAALAAAQLLPTFEYLGLTNRADGLPYAEVASESFEPASLLQFLLPHTFEGGGPGFIPEPGVPLFWSVYLGIAPLILVAAALATRPPLFWIATAVLAGLAAMGSHFFLFPALHAVAPSVIGSFRYAGKLFLPAHFALAVLAAVGIGRTLESARSRNVAMAAAGAAILSALSISLLVGADPERGLRILGYDLRANLSAETYAWIGSQVSAKAQRSIAFALVTSMLLGLRSRSWIGSGVFAILITLTTFLDLLTVHQPSLVFTAPGSLEEGGDDAVRVTRPGERVFHYAREPDGGIAPWLGRIRIAEPVARRARSLWAARVPNLPALDGATAVAGVDGFSPYVRIDFYRALASLRPEGALRLLAALGVNRIVGEERLDESGRRPALTREKPPLVAYDLPEAAPRAYLAERVSFAPDRAHALRALSRTDFRPGRDAVLIGTDDSVKELGGGTIERVSAGREAIESEMTLASPGLWIVTETWSPEWTATVDGEPAALLPVNAIHRGVVVPPGRHVVEMRYRPASFRLGRWISIGALVLLLPAALVAGRLAAPSTEPGAARGSRLGRLAWRGSVIALLLATFALPVVLMRGKSITNDEVAHLPAGYSYLKTGIVRLNPMHPPLVKELSALPLLFLEQDLPLPEVDLEDVDLPVTAQWRYGRHFLERPGLETMIFRGRLVAVALSLGLGVVIALWARSLWGEAGAALALFLYAFDPTITAHAQLVTTDVGVAFFSALYLYSLRAWVRRVSAARLVAAGLVLGLALGAKFSALVLLPITAAVLGVASWVEPDRFGTRSRRSAILRAAASALAMTAIGAFVVWALYFFPADPLFYLRGLGAVNVDHTAEHLFFLMGELEPSRWPHYLLVAWLVKTPLPTLLLLTGAVVAFVGGHRKGLLEEVFLLVPAAFLFCAYSAFTDPIGVRYMIPSFPFLFLFAGRLGPAVAGLERGRIAVAGLAVWVLVEYVSIWPDHLSYFNQIAGGPRGGVAWLDDSNVDWGQGMIQLRDHLEARGLGRYRVCFFQNFDWGEYGLGGEWIGIRELMAPPQEVLVLSAHCVARARVYLERLYGDGSENWMKHFEPATVVGHAYWVYDFREPLPQDP